MGNEYEDLLGVGNGGQGNEYDALLLEDGQEQETRARVGLSQPIQPDRQAAVLDLAARSKLPADIVERNFDDIQQRQERAELPYAAMQKQTPQTAAWLAETPENGPLAKDDLPRLGWLEWMLTAPGKAFGQGQAQVRAGNLRYRSIFGRLPLDDQLTLVESEAAMQGELGEETWFGKAITGGARQLPQLGEQLRRGTDTGLKVGMTLGAGTALAGQLGPQVVLPEELVTVPAAVATGLGIGMMSESARMGFEQESGHAYAEFLKFEDEQGNRIDEGAAKLAALAAGGINAGLEAVGLGILLKSIPGADKLVGAAGRKAISEVLRVPTVRAALTEAAKTYAGTLAKETAVEVAQRAITIMSGELAKVASGAETQGAGAIATDLGNEAVGAAQAFTFLSAPGPVMQAGAGVREAQKAQQRQQFFEALGEGTKESKLAQRLPAKLQELVGKITEGGPVETVYIPSADFQTMFQSKGVDPGQAAEQLLGSRTAYDEAVSTGNDIPVPMSVYAARIAPTELNGELAKVIRLRPNEMNAVEAEEYLAEQQAAAENAVPTEPDPVDAIREDITGQLLASGYERGTAEAMAEVQASFFNAQAQALGVSPADLFQRFQVSVNRDIPAVLREVGTTDRIDNLLDRFRLGQVPTTKEAYGESVTEFITRLGGILPNDKIDQGELRTRDLTRQGKGFLPLVNKGATKNLENMAEVAFEAGYIPEYDYHLLLDAIDQDLAGQPVYSSRPIDKSSAGDEQSRQDLALFEEMGRWLDEQGIDIKTATNAEIKAKLQQAQGETLEQPADGSARGSVTFPADRSRFDIRLMKDANLSTFLHESGHQFLEILGVLANDNPQSPIGRDFAEVLRWFGLQGRDPSARGPAQSIPDGLVLDADNIGNLFVGPTGAAQGDQLVSVQPFLGVFSRVADAVNDDKVLKSVVAALPVDVVNMLRGEQLSAEAVLHDPAMLQKHFTVDRSGDVAISVDMARALAVLLRVVAGAVAESSAVASSVGGTSRDGRPAVDAIRSDRHGRVPRSEQGQDRTIFDVWAALPADKKRELHEKFARGWEAFLMEGKAPNARLRAVFAKFRAWLVGIYRSVKGLNVELTDEVRGVMDRMLATDDEIKAAEAEASVLPLFATAADAGMTDAEFAAYQGTVTAASEQARDKLQAKVMAQLTREQQKWWKDERGKIRETVEAEVNAEPVYRALAHLQKGTLPDGEKLPDGVQPIKLSKAGLEARYGKATAPKGRLPKITPDAGMLAAATRGTPTTAPPVTFTPNVVMNRLKDLRVWDKTDGVDPEVAASYLGFPSADALVMGLVNARPRVDLIEAETDRRMLELHPDVRFDGSLAQQAEIEVNGGEGRERVLRAELAALRKKEREVRPFVRVAEQQGAEALRAQRAESEQAARDTAAQQRQARAGGLQVIRTATPQPELLRGVAARIIAAKRVRDINPESYLATARWQAKKAIEAAALGDKPVKPDAKRGLPGYASGWAWAADLKQRELLNHYLYREALAAREQVDKTLEFVKTANAKKGRDRLGKAGYLDQWDNILERFSFKRTTARKADQRTSLAEWAKEQEEAGLPVNLAPHVLDEARRESYVNLTFEELIGLRDALKQIQRFARLVTKLTASKDKREWEVAKAELKARALASSPGGQGPPISPYEDGRLKAFGRAIGEFADTLLRPETLIEWLDGGTSGPWHDYLWEPANRAEYGRETLRKLVTKPLQDLVAGMTKARRRQLQESVPIASLGRSLNRRTLISIALNLGNAGNRERLLKGGIRNGPEVQPLTEQNLQDVTNALTADDWQMVQTIWDTIDQLWPQIREFEERLTGQAPPRVEATPIDTPHGTFRGGYFPAVYDPYASRAGQKQADSGSSTDKLFANFTTATTGKGHTKARTAVGGPLLLDFERIIGRHVDQVITDLTHREFVIDALKILNDKELRLAIQDRQGTIAWSSLQAMLRHAVHSDYGFNDAADRMLGGVSDKLISNTAVAALGLKVATAIGNLALAPVQAAARVKPLWIMRGFGQFYRHPIEMAGFIHERSEMMRHRADNMDASFVEILQKLRGKRGIRAQVGRVAMSVHRAADWLGVHAIWLGAYQEALAAGETEAEAARLADKAIRTTQTAGAPKDLAALERNPMLRRTGLTLFLGPMVIMGNRLREAGQRKGVVKNWPEAFGTMLAVWFMPAILWDLVTGKDVDGADDDDSIPGWILRKILLYPLQTVPVVRELASAIEAKVTGQGFAGRNMPLVDAAKMVTDAGAAALEAGTEVWEGGEPDMEQLVKKSLRAAGPLTGLPTGQTLITGEFLFDTLTGDFEPETPLDWRYLVVQRPKELRD